jgi:hypothetical protein
MYKVITLNFVHYNTNEVIQFLKIIHLIKKVH